MKYESGIINKPTILYDEIVRGFFHLDRRLSTKLVIWIGYFIVKYPFLFRRILSFAYKLFKGRDYESSTNLRI